MTVSGVHGVSDDVLEKAAAWLEQGRLVALATVVSTWGSSPRPVGSQLVVDDLGNMLGSVSGGCIEGAVVHESMAVMEAGTPKLLEYGVIPIINENDSVTVDEIKIGDNDTLSATVACLVGAGL